ncbi:MAG: beta-ketoacyl synthase chain length factor [Endomicrobium sp.]|jgi:4-coumarate--CoA ligase (photoactive yellow protein activation family)|nr:beta-ketoacyl synthase chain length factor [Endomicrobium sp.]
MRALFWAVKIMNKLYVKSSAFADKANGIEEFFETKQLRRIDNFTKAALFAAAKTLYEAEISIKDNKEDIGLIIATGRGPVKQTCNFMDSIIDDGDVLASPLAFSSSVHNSLETAISILLNFRGCCCLTVSQGVDSFESAVNTAKSWLLSQRCKYVFLGAADEMHPVINKEYGHKIYSGTHAAFFLLTFEKTENEFIFSDIVKDDYNPTIQAFELAKTYSSFLNKKDIRRIISDYVKTYLAGRKKDVFSVFENPAIKDMLKDIDRSEKEEIFSGLKLLCSVNDANNEGNKDIENVCAKFINKSKQINFFTSGSTGLPKSCIHSQDMIKEETEGISFLFNKIKRVVTTVPSHHSYGFIFGLQLPKFMNLEVISKPPLPFLGWCEILQEDDLLVTFPLFLKYLIDINFRFPKGITVLTSTSLCPDTVFEEIYRRGAQRVIEIYGSSETGAIGFRESAGAPFLLLPFWNYEECGSEISKVFRKKTSLCSELPDIVASKGERCFAIIERKDHAVKVAGINVYPLKIEKILKKHTDIKDAVVRSGGDRLKAFIVLRDGVDEKIAKKSIYDYMQSVFTAHEIPKNITFGLCLPITIFGKKADW